MRRFTVFDGVLKAARDILGGKEKKMKLLIFCKAGFWVCEHKIVILWTSIVRA
jgi:hypothetical protein